ncbi:MAG: flagellar assembly protein FliW, partial [bacterium]
RFAVVNPMVFKPDYNPKINKKQIEDLKVKKPEELLLLVIITLNKEILKSTANLMGPVFINIAEKIGKQIVLEEENYSTREPIIGQETAGK